jgi:hypothetical protein
MSDYFGLIPNRQFPVKDPEDVLPFGIDFSEQMEADNDTLASLAPVTIYVLFAPNGDPTTLVVNTYALSGQQAVAILSGGTPGVTYVIHFVVTTTAGHIYRRSGKLLVNYR